MMGLNWVAIRQRIYARLRDLDRIIKAKRNELPGTATPGPAEPAAPGFLTGVATAERQTPVPPLPNPDEPKYAGDRQAYERDKQAADAAAKARGGAVAQVISKWLGSEPYAMFQELLAQPRDTMPIFKPAIGPVVVMRHARVLKCLKRTDLFTVDPYAVEMARATDDKTKRPEALSHFMLGTDRDEESMV